MSNLTKKDYTSDQEVRWCPGCGDYAILATMQRTLASLGIPKEKVVFVSGIGCAGRFPYYMDTYGFHSIHGRAFSVATGLKLARPDLTVFVITGDGDGLSIGLHHLMHTMRRNIDINILLFNNKIYGLTKGQYSPTSEQSKVTKSSPLGSIDAPLDPVQVAMAANCSFIGRTLDIDAKNLSNLISKSIENKGTSFIEIFQNCNIFNDGAFKEFSNKDTKAKNTMLLEDNKPLSFGENKENFLKINGLDLEVTTNSNDKDILVFNSKDLKLSKLVSELTFPEFPMPFGVIKDIQRSAFGSLLRHKKDNLKIKRKIADVFDAFSKWQI